MNPNYPSPGDSRAVAVHRRQEIQTLLTDNQRLAASHVALRQDVLAAEQDIRRLSAAALSIKSERDVQALQLRERMIKLEAEARSLEGINAELDRVRSDVKELREGNDMILDKLRDVEGELSARKIYLPKLEEVKDQIGILRREVQRGRAAVDFERKLQLYNSEAEDVMEKHLVSLARESEKLRPEVANAEKRVMVTTVPAPNPGPDYHGNFDPVYAGNLLPDPYAFAKNVFIATIDTSADTLVWAMTELVRNPKLMQKAQLEIRSHVGDKPLVPETEIKNLKYLNMVLKETFRMHPPATLLIPRESMQDSNINGYDVPAKTRIYVNAWAIGRDPETWENPDEFLPERFEGIDLDFKGQHFELLPFGAGRRMCPGVVMGMANVELTLANLLHCFDWELPDGMKIEDISVEDVFGLTTHKKYPLRLVPLRTC